MKKSSTVYTGDDARRRRRHFRAEWSAKGCHGPHEPLSYTDKYPLTKNFLGRHQWRADGRDRARPRRTVTQAIGTNVSLGTAFPHATIKPPAAKSTSRSRFLYVPTHLFIPQPITDKERNRATDIWR
jgi:hypothetical protein